MKVNESEHLSSKWKSKGKDEQTAGTPRPVDAFLWKMAVGETGVSRRTGIYEGNKILTKGGNPSELKVTFWNREPKSFVGLSWKLVFLLNVSNSVSRRARRNQLQFVHECIRERWFGDGFFESDSFLVRRTKVGQVR